MSHHIIEFDEQCKSCTGAGIYKGIAEKNGAGVVCHTCNGTGCHHVKIEYDDFKGKRYRKDIERVYAANPGICIGKNQEKGILLTDFGGMQYDDWFEDKPFPPQNENRKFTCPAWWYQSADYSKKPDWDECGWGGTFASCKCFPTKDSCWVRWDKDYTGTV